MPRTIWVINCSRRETSAVLFSHRRMGYSIGRELAVGRRGGGPARVKDDEKVEEKNDGAEDEHAAFRPVGAAAQQRIAEGCGGEQVAAGGQPAVGGAVKVGLAPVPGGMAADGPPGRAGDAHADAEDKA